MNRLNFYFVFLLIFCFQSLFSQELILRFSPERGSNLSYALLNEGTIVQSAMGVEQVLNTRTESKFTYFVQDISQDGDVEIVIYIDTIKTSIKAQMLAFDTTFVLPLGFKFKQVLDKYGKTKKFEILEMKEVPILGGTSGRVNTRDYLYSVSFPEGKLSPGDTWDFSYSDTSTGNGSTVLSTVRGRYTFEGVEEREGIKCARLGFNANLSISGQGIIQGMNYGLEGEGESVGTIWVDLKNGVLVHSEADTEIEMAMGISGQVEMTMPVSQKFRTKVNLLK